MHTIFPRFETQAVRSGEKGRDDNSHVFPPIIDTRNITTPCRRQVVKEYTRNQTTSLWWSHADAFHPASAVHFVMQWGKGERVHGISFGCRIRSDSRRVIFNFIMLVTREHDSVRQVNSPDFGSGGGGGCRSQGIKSPPKSIPRPVSLPPR